MPDIGLSLLDLQLCPSSLSLRHSALQGPHITDIVCSPLSGHRSGLWRRSHKTMQKDRDSDHLSIPNRGGSARCCSGSQPRPVPWQTCGSKKGIKKCFPLIPGVLSFLDTPKCASCGPQPYEELDVCLVRSESLAVPGCTHFLITHLGGSVHSLSENSSTHRYKSMCWKAGRQMASITPRNQTQNADDLQQLEMGVFLSESFKEISFIICLVAWLQLQGYIWGRDFQIFIIKVFCSLWHYDAKC